MNRLVTEGDRVYIEFCVKCEQHQWCTQHNSAKYLNYFNQCKAELQRFRSELRVLANEIPPKLAKTYHLRPEGEVKVVPGKLAFPRLGAFEVYYRGTVLFSKLESGLWPRPDLLCESLAKLQEELQRKADEAQARKQRKLSKGHKRRHKRKNGPVASSRTTPSRTLKSSHEPFRQAAKRPQTSKPRYRSAKRSRSPKSTTKGEFSGFSNVNYSKGSGLRRSSSSDRSVKQVQDEGVQADRFEARDVAKDFEDRDVWGHAEGKAEVWNLEEEQQPRFIQPERPKTAKRPFDAYAQPSVPTVPDPVIPPPLPELSLPKASSPPILPIPKENPISPSPPDLPAPQIPAKTPAFSEKEEPKPLAVPTPQAPDSPEETPKGRYSEESEEYESGEFEEEPTHPLRPVTKSYNVEIPMGKYTNKKIAYVNSTTSKANLTLVSSHPDEMQVKEAETSIDAGEKAPLKLQFNPVYEECEKTFYLYLDRDDEPCECFEFIVKFT